MDASKIMKTLNGMEVYDEAAREMISGVAAHSEDGVAYTATVKGVDALVSGANFLMIPDKDAADITLTLDVNGLGAKPIRQRLSTNAAATTPDNIDKWILVGKPVRVMYCVDKAIEYWSVDIPLADAHSLYGSVPVSSGGTGADNAAEALHNLGITWGTDAAPTTGTPNSIYIQIN